MKNFRIGNIIEINGIICQVILTNETGILAAHHTEPEMEFDKRLEFVPWANIDDCTKDVEISNFLLDKMFSKEIKRGYANFYHVWIVNADLKIEIREAVEGFNILCTGFEMFKIFSVRELQNVYAVLYENPIIGCRERRNNESPRELDEKLRNILKIG